MTGLYLILGLFYSMVASTSDPAYPWSWWWLACFIVVDILLYPILTEPDSDAGQIGEQGAE